MSLAEDGNSDIWIGTNSDGLNKLDHNTGKIYRTSKGYFNVLAVHSTGDQFVWAGTPQSGIRYNIKNEIPEFFLHGIAVQCYYTDENKDVWIGTNHGLYRYLQNDTDFDYTKIQRIDLEGSIESIKGDNDGNLWLTSTAYGLIRYSPRDGQRIVYGRKNNVYSESMAESSIYQVADGNLLIGSPRLNGYYEINPGKIRVTRDSSNLYFTALSLNGNDLTVGDGVAFAGSIFTAPGIRLNHDQNTFALRFTEIDFGDEIDKRIFYRLENYNTEWRQSYPEEPVSYYQIPPGDYIFKIRTSNSLSGRWSERTFAITIAPPWWTTWWAYSGYGLLLIILDDISNTV